MNTKDVNTATDGIEGETVCRCRLWRRQGERTVEFEVGLEVNTVAEYAFVKTTKVVRVVGIGTTMLFAEDAGEHTHLVEQVDGAQR